MRPDMDKVLCERPRSRARFRRRSLYRGPLEDAPRFESSSRNRGGDKDLSEHLGPLRRWLVRQVGRHWDAVYSELRSNISPKSAVQMHIWDHARHFVAERVVFVEGMPRAWNRTRILLWPRWTPVYVCPKTGILRKSPDIPNASKRQRKKQRAKARAKGRAATRARRKVRRGRPRTKTVKPPPDGRPSGWCTATR